MPPLRALSFDLDDTLWPIWPTIARAESALRAWLEVHAPRCAQAFDVSAMRALRDQVAQAHPEQAHDLSWLRRECIRQALAQVDEDEALAQPAFDVFFEHRQRVTLFDDALPTLRRLAARWPILALTNGNADLARIGLEDCFVGIVAAREVGVAKPHAGMFLTGCERLGCRPGEVLHVGDDLEMDVHGALRAGLQAVWLDRAGRPEASPAGAWRVAGLAELCERLGC